MDSQLSWTALRRQGQPAMPYIQLAYPQGQPVRPTSSQIVLTASQLPYRDTEALHLPSIYLLYIFHLYFILKFIFNPFVELNYYIPIINSLII